MCLSGPSFTKEEWVEMWSNVQADVAESSFQEKHDDVKCDNIQASIINHANGARSALFFLPFQSESAVMAIYPCPTKCVGNKDQPDVGLLAFKTKEAKVPCYKAEIDSYFCPEKHNEPQLLVSQPMFRSLGSESPDEDARSAPPSRMVLDDGKVCENADGSFTFTLKTAAVVKTLKEVEEMTTVAKQAYLTDVSNACVTSLLKAMREFQDMGKFKTDTVFDMAGDEIDDTSRIHFMDMLLPNLQAGCDMLVAIPPPDPATGKPSAAGTAAFTFAFHFPPGHEELPLLGLAHNVGPNDPAALARGDLKYMPQEDNYWVVVNQAPQSAHAVIKDKDDPDSNATPYHLIFPEQEQLVMPPGLNYSAEDYNHDSYYTSCHKFQNARKEQILAMWRTFCGHQGLPALGGSTHLAVTNLKGSKFSPMTSSLHFPHFSAAPGQKPSASEVRAAIGVMKEGNDGWWNNYGEYEEAVTKRPRIQAAMDAGILGINVNADHGDVTANLIAREIEKRVGAMSGNDE